MGSISIVFLYVTIHHSTLMPLFCAGALKQCWNSESSSCVFFSASSITVGKVMRPCDTRCPILKASRLIFAFRSCWQDFLKKLTRIIHDCVPGARHRREGEYFIDTGRHHGETDISKKADVFLREIVPFIAAYDTGRSMVTDDSRSTSDAIVSVVVLCPTLF